MGIAFPYRKAYNEGQQRQETGLRQKEGNMASDNCEFCANYVYDEQEETYYCDVNLDEDEMYRFLKGDTRACPYFVSGDEYKVVRHQM